MERIIIKKDLLTSIIYFNQSEYYGYSIDNNGVILSYIPSLKEIKDIFKYHGSNYDNRVVIDKETNLKHFIVNNKDDLSLLFKYNGESLICFNGYGNLSSTSKLFRIKKMLVIISLSGLVLLNSVNYKPVYQSNINYDVISDYELSDLKSLIYLSTNLTIDEKDYLYNEDFLIDYLKVVNSSNYEKYFIKEKFENISVNSFDSYNNKDEVNGYYSYDNPNILFVKDYKGLNIVNERVVAHEFIHLCQDIEGYNLIIEACAEIISYEYYNNKVASYFRPVKLVKKLMEIIGSEPIWVYIFTNDFSLIDNKVRPYLTDDEYQLFLDSLTFSIYKDNMDESNIKFDMLDDILGKLYYRIYDDDIENNKIISLIESDEFTLKRYYFNERKMNESYYIDYKLGEYETIPVQEAIDNNLIKIYAYNRYPITNHIAFKMIDNNEPVYREINYSLNNMIFISSSSKNNKEYITMIINGVKYENADVDELVKDGIIKVNYYKVKIKELSYEEYLAFEESVYSTTYISKPGDSVIENGLINIYVPKKVDLDPVIKEKNYLNYY